MRAPEFLTFRLATLAEPDAPALRKLAILGLACLVEHREEFGDVAGDWLEDAARKLGVLVSVPVSEPCGELCACCEYYGSDEFPVECLRLAPDVEEIIAIVDKEIPR